MTAPVRNGIIIRRADNGWVVYAYSTIGLVSSKIQDERLRYTIHRDEKEVVEAVKKLMKLINESLEELPER